MSKFVLIGFGGFVGSVFRFALSDLVSRLSAYPMIPYGTLAVNIFGCLLIGFIGSLNTETKQLLSPEARVFLLVGILGGFTTFSAFGFETFNLIREGKIFSMLLHVTAHIAFGICAVWIGSMLSRLV